MQALSDPRQASARVEADSALWQRSLGGDGRAFGSLFERHRNRVFQHAYRLAGTRQDAEDVVATSFLELWRLRQRVRLVDGSILPWLLATTTNIGLNAARARRRYQDFLERLPRSDQQPDAADTALDLIIDHRVKGALRELKPKDAQLLALVALEGYPVNEAAACLAFSPEVARARLHRARQRLQAQLGHDLSLPEEFG